MAKRPRRAPRRMNNRTRPQRRAFLFFREHLQTQEPFTIDQFVQATGWNKPGTFQTYIGKQYKGLIEAVNEDEGEFRVTDAFWKFVTWRKFRGHVTQVRRVVSTYEPKSSNGLIYDFLMPLTNEEHLRMTLDSLFYKDRVHAQLRTISIPALSAMFPKAEETPNEQYFQENPDLHQGSLHRVFRQPRCRPVSLGRAAFDERSGSDAKARRAISNR